MIFGDGAAAMVIGVAPQGEPPDIEYLQTYASGPATEVNSNIWPNPAIDNNITVYGPEVKSLAGRYLVQMIDELKVLPDPVVPDVTGPVAHSAGKILATSVERLLERRGIADERIGGRDRAPDDADRETGLLCRPRGRLYGIGQVVEARREGEVGLPDPLVDRVLAPRRLGEAPVLTIGPHRGGAPSDPHQLAGEYASLLSDGPARPEHADDGG